MKPNWLVVLVVGIIIGLSVTKLACNRSPESANKPSSSTQQAIANAQPTEASLAVKSADLPAGTFDGMSESQKYAALKVLNDNECSCGCEKESLAKCASHDPNCPIAPQRVKQAVELAKANKMAAQIQAEMFGAIPAKPATAGRATEKTIYRVPIEGAPVQGKPTALITMVEFSDYQCPFCSRANGTVRELETQYGDQLRVVMKQNPLPFHEHAKGAALAALAAGQQNKYWEMHEKLFANQTALDDASIERYAEQIGLNVAKWKEAMKSSKLQETIQKDQALAQSLGATGTPAFFINGRKIAGAQPIDAFRRVIDEEMPNALALVKSGVKPDAVYAKVMENAVSRPVAPTPPTTPPIPTMARKIDVPQDAPIQGPKAAKVTIVEWSDFQCPFCSRAIPTLKQIEETYPKDVRVVFRHQPLPFHNNAKLAAEASMAANEQGKFWQYHDKLFANQQALDRASLENYASELKLNMTKFKAALDSGKFRSRVESDMSAGSAAGANGTPTFFINGRQLVGAQPFPSFKAVIDEEIGKANRLIASGVKPDKVYEKLMAEASAAPPPAPSQAPGAPAAPPPVQNVAVGSAPVKGSPNAPVTIVEFSDFQCPFCSRAVPTLKQIESEYPDKVRVAFKNQPLPFHQHARLAAQAAMAANEQGKFWEYHDKLFANQQALDRSSLERYAQEVGLDMGRFRSALDSNKFEAQISADAAEGSRLGASGTPTFYINGRQLVGAQPYASFKQIIDEELSKKSR